MASFCCYCSSAAAAAAVQAFVGVKQECNLCVNFLQLRVTKIQLQAKPPLITVKYHQ
jgi:hypothetical protein